MNKYMQIIDNDQSIWFSNDWEIETSNVPVDTMNNLDTSYEIISTEIDSIGGEVKFLTEPKVNLIDQSVHLTLLEENLKEYEDIWRELAGR
jgi:hypothetical protein